MKRLLSNQICPNLLLSDALYLWAHLPCIWSRKQLDFSKYLGTKDYILTNSARTALSLIIQETTPDKTKKIGIPAFCCCVMATPFLTAGYEIQWLDTDENGLIDPAEVERHAQKLSMVLIPHIFGQLAPVQQIVQICKQHDIITIEDCAHHIPDTKETLLTDFRVYSFGREKVLSCVSGGALAWNQGSQNLKSLKTEKLEKKGSPASQLPSSLARSKASWTLKHMLQPLIYSLALPLWYQGGKILPTIAQKLRLLPKAVTASEKKGREDFPQSTLPFPLQKLLLRQFKQYPKTLSHREKIAKKWKEKLSTSFPQKQISIPPNALRVLLKTEEEKQPIMDYYKSKGLLLNDWDGVPMSPTGVDYERFGYKKGTCPNAETFASQQITFPTSIRVKEKNLIRSQ